MMAARFNLSQYAHNRWLFYSTLEGYAIIDIRVTPKDI